MLTRAELEEKILDKKLTAPRITLQGIENKIVDAKYHVFEGTTLTVCCLILDNGFTVVGESACASPENFDKELGEEFAYRNAKEKIWQLEGYAFTDRKHRKQLGE